MKRVVVCWTGIGIKMSWDKWKVAAIFSKLQTDFTIKFNLSTFCQMVKKLFRPNFKRWVTHTESINVLQ